MNKESLIVRHVGDIYRNSNDGKNHSWSILNGALDTALRNCIGAHLRFQEDDFQTLFTGFKGGYWFGTNRDGRGFGERYYSLSVEAGNMSACVAFEKWAEFKPYLYVGRRLCVGREVWWLKKSPSKLIRIVPDSLTEHGVLEKIERHGIAHRWFVTGLSSETLRLSSYYKSGNSYGHQTGKPTKLMQLTHEQIETASKDIRAAIKDAPPKKEKEAKP